MDVGGAFVFVFYAVCKMLSIKEQLLHRNLYKYQIRSFTVQSQRPHQLCVFKRKRGFQRFNKKSIISKRNEFHIILTPFIFASFYLIIS